MEGEAEASGASTADGGGRGWMEATVADDGYRGGCRRPWRMGRPPQRMEAATVAERPRWMGWLMVVKGSRDGVAVADGGFSGGRWYDGYIMILLYRTYNLSNKIPCPSLDLNSIGWKSPTTVF